MSLLFSPVRIGQHEARNRVWLAPMCQYSCEAQDGMPTEWHHEHLASFARGGVGVAMTEAAAVSPEGRISPWDAGIWSDEQAEAWAPIAARIAAHGALPAIQLAHAGRKGSTYREWSGQGSVPVAEGGWEAVGATDAAFGPYAPPRALTTEEVEQVVADFAAAAKRAWDAGFVVLEVHAAHGYLIHQFLSPLVNDRDDIWGERTLLLRRTVEAVRAAAPEAGIVVRFSAHDWVAGGIDETMTAEHARVALAAGADWLDISSGGLDPRQQIQVGPGYQVPLAASVREATGAPVAAVGMLDDAELAEATLAEGSADAIMIARGLLRNPHWALLAEAELDGAPEGSAWPVQYTRARPRPVSVAAGR
ncbi:tRNA-dihydrouridine synthase [Agrococcus terreus]|uniref:Oxidoreductase n=1 Tax=Agrococcus terreus TaxID=574649 RepID=A0ABQ2KFX8_9MICO|nr:tRNA-dihydrouridine synthase [Agrococcus terreus]GGN80040.1 oxidoreductase [Agrococcus terreus]